MVKMALKRIQIGIKYIPCLWGIFRVKERISTACVNISSILVNMVITDIITIILKSRNILMIYMWVFVAGPSFVEEETTVSIFIYSRF